MKKDAGGLLSEALGRASSINGRTDDIKAAYECFCYNMIVLINAFSRQKNKLRPAVLHRAARRRGFMFVCVILFIAVIQVRSASAVEPDEGGGREEEESANANPHVPGDLALCSACHTANPPALSFDAVTTCVKCHAGNVDNHPVSSHPIGSLPRISVPSSMPLTKDGKMVCYTCHDPHNRHKRGKMLRVDYQTICVTCHVGY